MARPMGEEHPPAPVAWLAGYLIGIAGLAAGITLVFLGMRAVMDIGGACATGGPYVPAVECPEGVPLAMLLGIFGGMASAALATVAGARIQGPWGGIALLAWPALFLSLGWNFLEYGLAPPGEEGLAWGWLLCGAVFVVMGAGPVLAGIRWREDVRAGIVATELDATTWPRVRRIERGDDRWPGSPGAGSFDASLRESAAPGLVDELERLAALRERGDLSADEYAAAKRALLGEVRP